VNALASPEVGRYLNEHFVSSFQKVATFRIVNGAKQGGNVAAYFCAPDGRVLHAVAGPVDAETMLHEARWVVASVRKAMDESKRTGTTFKALFRRWHAERLGAEHGLQVEPVTFDPPAAGEGGPLTYRDPTGRPLAPVLPPPPIEGPDVSFARDRFEALQEAEAKADGARRLVARCGTPCVLGTKGQVHQLLSSYSLLEIERLYGTVFQDILGEKVSTDPVITIESAGGSGGKAVCLHCESRRGLELPEAVLRD
jgi:hypothetical protein